MTHRRHCTNSPSSEVVQSGFESRQSIFAKIYWTLQLSFPSLMLKIIPFMLIYFHEPSNKSVVSNFRRQFFCFLRVNNSLKKNGLYILFSFVLLHSWYSVPLPLWQHCFQQVLLHSPVTSSLLHALSILTLLDLFTREMILLSSRTWHLVFFINPRFCLIFLFSFLGSFSNSRLPYVRTLDYF